MRTRTKTKMPVDELAHTVPLADGLRFFGELIESKEHWIFLCDETGRLMLKAIIENYCTGSAVGEVFSLFVPLPGDQARLALAAIKKTLVSARRLKRELRVHAGLNLSTTEISARDVFLVVSAYRIQFATALIKHITKRPAESHMSPWFYGCQN